MVAVAAGSSHSLALRNDGTVVAWGANSFGRTNVPSGLAEVAAIAAGGNTSLALKKDGRVVEWGYPFGVPTGLSNVVAIAAGIDHALALTSNGVVTSWGGLDNYNQTDVPPGLSNVIAIAAGGYHSLALVSTNPLAFMQQPERVTVVPNATAVLKAGVVGTPPIHYQWQLNGTDIPGETNTALLLPNIQPTDEGNYNVAASSTLGTATSSNAFLKVVSDLGEALNVTNLVLTSSTNPGWFPETGATVDGEVALSTGPLVNPEKATLQTTVTGPGKVSFWWQLRTQCDDNFIFKVDGTNQVFLRFSTSWCYREFYLGPGTHSLEWSCFSQHSDPSGFCTVTGWLDQLSYVSGPTPALIIRPPLDITLSAGSDTTLNVLAGGTPILSYQWQHNGSNIVGATRSWLTLTNLQSTDSGVYTVTVSNDFGTTNAASSLIVTSSPPVILTQPSDQRSVWGGNCSLMVNARGSDPLNYQWQFDGQDMVGATNSRLILYGPSSNNVGIYSVAISNANGDHR